jgi:hypothetical protein
MALYFQETSQDISDIFTCLAVLSAGKSIQPLRTGEDMLVIPDVPCTAVPDAGQLGWMRLALHFYWAVLVHIVSLLDVDDVSLRQGLHQGLPVWS